MNLSYKKLLILCLLIIFPALYYFYNFNEQISIEAATPKLIGVKLNYNYKYENNSPVVRINWEWKEKSVMNKDIQDLVGVIWDNPEQWVSSTDTIEGGGGPALFALESLKGRDSGISYIGKPLKQNGNVEFRLLSNPPNTTPNPPKTITVFFIHPEKKLLSSTKVYIIKENVTISR